MKQTPENETVNTKTKRARQIGALICVVLLVLLYVATLVFAILDFEGSDQLFAACLMATVGLPILLWIYIWVYGKYTGRRTLADAPESKAAKAKSENPAASSASKDSSET